MDVASTKLGAKIAAAVRTVMRMITKRETCTIAVLKSSIDWILYTHIVSACRAICVGARISLTLTCRRVITA